MNASYHVSTVAIDNHIEQVVSFSSPDFSGLIMRRVADIQDQQFKQALILMGWTPPAEESQCVSSTS